MRTEVFARKENEVDLLADLLADPMDPTDPLTTRRTRKTAGWRRNAPSLRHRGATDANGVTGLAGVADAADGSFCEKENEVDLLADPTDPTDPLATRRTRKTAGWRRNAPSLRHRGATDANGVTGLAGVADAADGSFCEKENEVDLLADPTDPLATRRTRKTVGWRRNAPVLRHRGATGAAGVAGLAGVADATDGRVHEKEN